MDTNLLTTRQYAHSCLHSPFNPYRGKQKHYPFLRFSIDILKTNPSPSMGKLHLIPLAVCKSTAPLMTVLLEVIVVDIHIHQRALASDQRYYSGVCRTVLPKLRLTPFTFKSQPSPKYLYLLPPSFTRRRKLDITLGES